MAAATVPLVSMLAACGQEPTGACTPAAELDQVTGDDQERRTADSDTTTGEPIPLSADPRISEQGLALSPDGSRLAAGEWWERHALGLSETRGTTLWDTTSGEILERFDNGLTGPLAWHPDGQLLACAGTTHIDLTDPRGRLQHRLTGHGEGRGTDTAIRDLVFSPDGRQLASLSTDGTVRLWAVGTDRCAPGQVLRVRRLQARSLSCSPDGSTLAICGPGRAPELWDVATGSRTSRLRQIDGKAQALDYAPDGSLLISTDDPLSLLVMAPDGDLVEGPAPRASTPSSIAVSSTGRVAVAGDGDNQVLVWDPETEEQVDLPRLPGSVGRMRWSPEGDILYGASRHGGVMAWDGGEAWRAFVMP